VIEIMFTGIIEEIGFVKAIEKGRLSAKLSIHASDNIFSDIKLGDSVSVNGACLTVSELKSNVFIVDVMLETLNRTNLVNLKIGSNVNLERAMLINSRFGGHIVSGHIDGLGKISSIYIEGNAVIISIKTNQNIMRYVIEKGSIAIDGISLTIMNVTNDVFSVSIIPHTFKNTTLSQYAIGDSVNLENDIIGKYVDKLLNNKQINLPQSNISKEFLEENGF